MNYKIRVESEAESKEAQELLLSLGGVLICGKYFYENTDAKAVCLINNHIFLNDISFESCDDALKEITFQELRDLVVLKRNDVGDHTNGSSFGSKFYHCCNGDVYAFNDGSWVFDHTKASKLIEKPMKEWLNTETYEYKKAVDMGGHSKWIEIPKGCDIVTCQNRMGNFVYFHWKSLDSDEFFLKDEKIWSNNFNETLSDFIEKNEGDVKIIWQRHTQPEELPFIDDEPSLNDQYAEIEKVRQSEKVLKEILEGNLPEFDFESNVEQDNVNQPVHYCSHPSGIECIEITRHHDFAIGNAIKYLWRAGLKDSSNEIQDLEKSVWYIQDKINQLKKQNANSCKD